MSRWVLIALSGALLAGSIGYLVLRSQAPEPAQRDAARPLIGETLAQESSPEELATARREFLECRTRLNFAQLAQRRPLLRGMTKEELQGVTTEEFRAFTAECKRQLPAQ
ncbi:MAG: hypothetical protein ABI895_40310 [Deltaproteobacteria bacterium]